MVVVDRSDLTTAKVARLRHAPAHTHVCVFAKHVRQETVTSCACHPDPHPHPSHFSHPPLPWPPPSPPPSAPNDYPFPSHCVTIMHKSMLALVRPSHLSSPPHPLVKNMPCPPPSPFPFLLFSPCRHHAHESVEVPVISPRRTIQAICQRLAAAHVKGKPGRRSSSQQRLKLTRL